MLPDPAELPDGPETPDPPERRVEVPWLGPVLIRHGAPLPSLALGADPQLGSPTLMCLVPVREGGRCWEVDGDKWKLLAEDEEVDWLRELPPGEAGDWFNVPVPPWASRYQVEHLVVLLVYDQSREMGAANYEKFAETKPQQPVADAWLRQRINAAINRFKRARPGLPRGIVRVGWPARGGLRIALGSCQYPPGIVNLKPGFESWRGLGDTVRGDAAPDLVVLAGDQIYADATAGLFDPAQLGDRYRKPYESWLRNRDVGEVLQRIPCLTTLDDHEIDENWEPISADCPQPARDRNDSFRDDGVKAFLRFQRGIVQPSARVPLWFPLVHNGVPVFVLDSRTERALRPPVDGNPATMLGPAQWLAFTGWLRQGDPATPKLIVSAAALLPRHRRANGGPLAAGRSDTPEHSAWLQSDGWDGFPETFHELLALIAQENLHKLVFVSGDEHLGLYAKGTLTGSNGKPVEVHSIHSPGLNAPYRFANTKRDELVLDADSFTFEHRGITRSCTVETQVFENCGFVDVALVPDSAGWLLKLGFPGYPPLTIRL